MFVHVFLVVLHTVFEHSEAMFSATVTVNLGIRRVSRVCARAACMLGSSFAPSTTVRFRNGTQRRASDGASRQCAKGTEIQAVPLRMCW